MTIAALGLAVLGPFWSSMFKSLGMGDDDCSPWACSIGTFLVLDCFLGFSMDEESLRVIIY